jgi:tetratricopeptide (TPR) repeat protein
MSRLAKQLWENSSKLDIYLGIALVAVTLLAYQPAWNGKPIMDDNTHLTAPIDRSLSGLGRLWFNPRLSHQYHPLVDTVFWLEDKLWGESMLGYHIVNILLHGTCAILLLRILQRMTVPGAWLAAAIFALHPVQVESVAFLVELKNTLSGALLFAAVLAYLRFDQKRDWKSYALVWLLVLIGLLAKSLVAYLPVCVLLAVWWKRGRLEYRRDVRPLLPFFVFGILAALATGWMEREFSDAKGEGFEFSMIDRVLIAGRAFWFYLGKIVWPTKLVLMYPRWTIDPTVWWQFLFPIAAILALAAAWILRHRWRWLWAGLFFFTVTLLPFIGFFNVRLFRFQFVSDHFQYLPIIGIITPVAAGAMILLDHVRDWMRIAAYSICLALLATLAALTWEHSWMFRDAETCYRTVIKTNPHSWPPQLNLGLVLSKLGRLYEARPYLEKALQLHPDRSAAGAAYLNLGNVYLNEGRFAPALDYFNKSLQARPDFRSYNSIGSLLRQQGKLDEAIANYEKALELMPESPATLGNLAWVLATAPADSLRNGPRSLELALRADRFSDGKDPSLLQTLAAAYAETGDFSQAVATAHRAVDAANQRGVRPLADELRAEIALYELGLPYRETSTQKRF